MEEAKQPPGMSGAISIEQQFFDYEKAIQNLTDILIDLDKF